MQLLPLEDGVLSIRCELKGTNCKLTLFPETLLQPAIKPKQVVFRLIFKVFPLEEVYLFGKESISLVFFPRFELNHLHLICQKSIKTGKIYKK